MAGREFVVLYTHQKRKKAKVWQDGVLKVNDQGTKADLIGAGNKRLDQVHIKGNQAAVGEELESEKYLITIEENVSSDKPNPDVVNHEKAQANQPDHIPHTQAPRRQPLKRKRTGFVPPRQVNKRPSPEKENPPQTQESQQLATSSGFGSPRSSLFSSPCSKTEVSSPQGPNILNMYGRSISTVKAAQSSTHHAASELQHTMRNNTRYDPQQVKDDFQPESQEWNDDYTDDQNLPSHHTATGFSSHPESTGRTVLGVDPCELQVKSQPEMDLDMRGTWDDREGGSDLSRTDSPAMNKSSFSTDPSSTNQDLWRTSSEQDRTSYRKHTDLSASSVMPGTNPDSVETRLPEETKDHTGNAPGAKRSTSRILALLGKGKKPFQPPLKQKTTQDEVSDTSSNSSTVPMKHASSRSVLRSQGSLHAPQSNYQASVISSEPVKVEKDVSDEALSHDTESQPTDSLFIHTSREFDADHMGRTAASMRTSQHHSIPSENDLVRLKATSGQAAEGGHRESAVYDEPRVFQESQATRQNQHMKHCLNKRTGLETDKITKRRKVDLQCELKNKECKECKGIRCTCNIPSRDNEEELSFSSTSLEPNVNIMNSNTIDVEEIQHCPSERVSEQIQGQDRDERSPQSPAIPDVTYSHEELVSETKTGSSSDPCQEEEEIKTVPDIDDQDMKSSTPEESPLEMETTHNAPDTPQHLHNNNGAAFDEVHKTMRHPSLDLTQNEQETTPNMERRNLTGDSSGESNCDSMEICFQIDFDPDDWSQDQSCEEDGSQNKVDVFQRCPSMATLSDHGEDVDKPETNNAHQNDGMGSNYEHTGVKRTTDGFKDITDVLQKSPSLLSVSDLREDDSQDTVHPVNSDTDSTCTDPSNVIASFQNMTEIDQKFPGQKSFSDVGDDEDKPEGDDAAYIIHPADSDTDGTCMDYVNDRVSFDSATGVDQKSPGPKPETAQVEDGDNLVSDDTNHATPPDVTFDDDDDMALNLSCEEDWSKNKMDVCQLSPTSQKCSDAHHVVEKEAQSLGKVSHCCIDPGDIDTEDASLVSRCEEDRFKNTPEADVSQKSPSLKAVSDLHVGDERDKHAREFEQQLMHSDKANVVSMNMNCEEDSSENIFDVSQTFLGLDSDAHPIIDGKKSVKQDMQLGEDPINDSMDLNGEYHWSNDTNDVFQRSPHLKADTDPVHEGNLLRNNAQNIIHPVNRNLHTFSSELLDTSKNRQKKEHVRKLETADHKLSNGPTSHDLESVNPDCNSQQSTATSVDTLDFSQDTQRNKDTALCFQDIQNGHFFKGSNGHSPVPSQDIDALVPDMELMDTQHLPASPSGGYGMTGQPPSKEASILFYPTLMPGGEQSVPEISDSRQHKTATNQVHIADKSYGDISSMGQCCTSTQIVGLSGQASEWFGKEENGTGDSNATLSWSSEQDHQQVRTAHNKPYLVQTSHLVPGNLIQDRSSSDMVTYDNFKNSSECHQIPISVTPNQAEESIPVCQIRKEYESDSRFTWNTSRDQRRMQLQLGSPASMSNHGSKQETWSPVFELPAPEELRSLATMQPDHCNNPDVRLQDNHSPSPASAILPHPSYLKTPVRRNATNKSDFVVCKDQSDSSKGGIYWKQFVSSGKVRRNAQTPTQSMFLPRQDWGDFQEILPSETSRILPYGTPRGSNARLTPPFDTPERRQPETPTNTEFQPRQDWSRPLHPTHDDRIQAFGPSSSGMFRSAAPFGNTFSPPQSSSFKVKGCITSPATIERLGLCSTQNCIKNTSDIQSFPGLSQRDFLDDRQSFPGTNMHNWDISVPHTHSSVALDYGDSQSRQNSHPFTSDAGLQDVFHMPHAIQNRQHHPTLPNGHSPCDFFGVNDSQSCTSKGIGRCRSQQLSQSQNVEILCGVNRRTDIPSLKQDVMSLYTTRGKELCGDNVFEEERCNLSSSHQGKSQFHMSPGLQFDNQPSGKELLYDGANDRLHGCTNRFQSDDQLSNSTGKGEVRACEVDATRYKVEQRSYYQEPHDLDAYDISKMDEKTDLDKLGSLSYASSTERRREYHDANDMNVTDYSESAIDLERALTPDLFITQPDGSVSDYNSPGESSKGHTPLRESMDCFPGPLSMDHSVKEEISVDQEHNLDLEQSTSINMIKTSFSRERKLTFNHKRLISKPTDEPSTPLPKVFRREIVESSVQAVTNTLRSEPSQCENNQIHTAETIASCKIPDDDLQANSVDYLDQVDMSNVDPRDQESELILILESDDDCPSPSQVQQSEFIQDRNQAVYSRCVSLDRCTSKEANISKCEHGQMKQLLQEELDVFHDFSQISPRRDQPHKLKELGSKQHYGANNEQELALDLDIVDVHVGREHGQSTQEVHETSSEDSITDDLLCSSFLNNHVFSQKQKNCVLHGVPMLVKDRLHSTGNSVQPRKNYMYEPSNQFRVGTSQQGLAVGQIDLQVGNRRGNTSSLHHLHHAHQNRTESALGMSGSQTQTGDTLIRGVPGRERREVKKGFRTPVSMMSNIGMHGDLNFPAADTVHSGTVRQREIVIPVSFPNVSSYKQIMTEAVKEHLNILLLELSHRYHSTMEKADITSYTKTHHSGDPASERTGGGGGNPPCKHGQPAKMVCVKKDGPNKGRMFYTCNNQRENQCKFFVWADQHAAQAPQTTNQQPSQSRAKIALHNAESIEQFARTNQVHLYCECQLSRRGSLNEGPLGSAPAWIKKYRAQRVNNTTKKLYIKLDRKEHSSTYAKDDLWIITQDLSFDPSSSFVAKSMFHGPSSTSEIEMEPLTGYSPSNWSTDGSVYGILVCNASSELTCLGNIQEHVNPRTFPILPHLISCEPERNPSSLHGRAFVKPSRSRHLNLPASLITELVEDTIRSYHLNPDQSSALHQVAGMVGGDDLPVTLIHGVFGAGKSYLLAIMVLFLVKLFKLCEENETTGQEGGWKVLIASTTNVAVDRILLGLLELGFEDFIRVGSLRKIAKPVLPYSVHASDKENQEMKELQEMLKGDLTLNEKQFVRKSIERHRLGKNKEMLSKVKVIGVTCAACSFPCIKNLTFPVVLLDECSQMTEPSSLLPMARFGCEKLVLVGDPHQLDPTIQGSESAHKSGLEQTLFDRLSLMGYDPIMLRTQYRCHPCISSLANTLFYDGQLLDGVIEEDRPPLLPNLPTLCFFNISHGREMSARDGSYFNDPEASFVVFLIGSMMEMGISPSDVGVITLYKAQVSRIRMLLQTSSTQNSSELKAIQISTVDAFQGGEKSIIILSCVRTQRVGFIDSDKRTNVALTRSKNHLLIVGGMKMLSDNHLWGEIVHKCQERSDGIQDSKAFQKQWEGRLRELKQDADLEPVERPRRTREKRRKLERSEREHSPAMSLDSNDEDFVSSVSQSVPGTSNACKPAILEMDCSIKNTLLHPTGSPSSFIGDDDLPCIDLSTPPEDERLSNARSKMDCMESPRSQEVASAAMPVAFQVDNTSFSPHSCIEGDDLPLVNLDTVPKVKDIGDATWGADHKESSHSEEVESQGRRDPVVQEPSETPDASISYSPLEHVVESDSEESDEDLPNFNIGNIL